MKQKNTIVKLRETTIIILIVMCVSTLQSQVIFDKAKAPINPTGPYVLYAKNYDAKGDVASINFTLYDRSGKPIDDRISYNKEIAKQNKMIYHKVENGLITEVVDYQYSPTTELYQYSNDLITREENGAWVMKYEYDNQKRLIEKQAESKKGNRPNTTTSYTYENLPEGKLKINIKVDYSDGTDATNGFKIFKDGLLIEDMNNNVYTYLFDAKGNFIKKSWSGLLSGNLERDIVYYSDLEKIDNQGYINWKKEYLYGTKLLVPSPQLRERSIQKSKAIYSERVLDNGVLFYLPTTQKYYYSADAFDENKPIGTTGNAKLVIQDTDAVLQSNGKQVVQIYNGRKVKNGRNLFFGNSYFVYDTINKRGFYNKTYKTPNETFYNTNVLEGDAYIFSIDPTNKRYGFYVKGEPIDYSKVGPWKYTKSGDPIIFYNGSPIAILEDYFNINESMLSVAKPYSGEQIFDSPNANKNIENTISTKQTTNTKKVNSCISGNCTDGYGTFIFESGAQITGFFKNGKANGFAELIFSNGNSYAGNFYNGLRNGYGIYQWKEINEQYYGHWKDNKQHGYGYFVNDGETVQAGIYNEGKLVTNLLTDFSNGKSNGNCLGNCTNGYGSITYNQGDVYEGLFKDGKPYKAGSYMWTNGNSYMGDWDDLGKINYSGQFFTSTFVYKGAFAHNGFITGLGVKLDKITNVITYGEFKQGKLIVDYSN